MEKLKYFQTGVKYGRKFIKRQYILENTRKEREINLTNTNKIGI